MLINDAIKELVALHLDCPPSEIDIGEMTVLPNEIIVDVKHSEPIERVEINFVVEEG